MADKKAREESLRDTGKSNDSARDEHVADAHTQADKDIENDHDLNSRPERGDDLDEGELARLEGED